MSEKRPPYLKLPQDFFDLSASAALGAVTFLVYLHIRRYVWRSGRRRGDFQPKPSQVVAYVNQSALGGAVGINRQNVSLHIKKLERLGWLKRLNTDGDKTERAYELGFRTKGVGEEAEVYFADQRMASYRKQLGESLKTMNAKQRADAIRALMEDTLVSPARQALSRQQDKPCLASKTSLVLLARHQNREGGNTQSRNTQGGKPLRGASAGAEAARSLRSLAAVAPAKKNRAPPETEPTTPSSARPPPPKKGSDDVNRLDMLKLAESVAKKKNFDTRLAKAEKRARKEKNLGGVAGGKGAPIRRLYEVWCKLLREKWPDLPEDHIGVWWTHRERLDGAIERRATKEAGQCRMLVQKFSEDAVEGYFRYAITNWEALRERFKKAPLIPSVGFLLSLSSTLMPESALARRKQSARAELEAWFEAHPGENPPEELMARFKGLSAAGGS